MSGSGLQQLEFDVAEYQRRWRAVQQLLAHEQVDVLLVDEAENVRYLSGYLPTAARHQYLLVPVHGDPVACVRALDEPAFAGHTPIDNYVTFADDEDSAEYLPGLLGRLGTSAGRLALEADSHHLTPQRRAEVEASVPDGIGVVVCDSLVREVRLTKSTPELDCMRRSAGLADAITRAVAAAVRPGTTTRELAAIGYACGLRGGADNTRMLLISAGTADVVFHGGLDDRPLCSGDIVHVEAVPQVQGYSARIMRPVAVGPLAEQTARLADALVEIQDEQIAAMRPGAVAAEVDRICREAVMGAGLRTTYPNATAYTLGLHATPRTSDFTRALTPMARWTLEPWMTFHVYSSAGPVTMSETVLVGESGPERLTQLPRRVLDPDADGQPTQEVA